MARYIDADILIKKIFPYDGVDKKLYSVNAQSVYNAIENSPTADVVPKSEVAREIFEEIEKYMTPLEDWFLSMKKQNQDCSEEYWSGKLSAFKQIRGFIDVELKKKYTEDI